MDKTLLNLLFNYRGEVTYKQMQAATIILFIALGYSFYPMISHLLGNVVIGQMGPERLASYSYYSRVTSSFIPNLIPAWFIVSYTSFIVGFKRVRTLGGSKALAIFSGISLYLFLSSISSSTILVSMIEGFAFIEENSLLKFINVLPYIEVVFIVLGVINLVLLCIRRSSEVVSSSYKEKGSLGVIPYIMKLGRIMFFFALAGVAMGLILFMLNLYERNLSLVYILSSLLVVGALIFYLRYTVYRMRDAGIPVFWLTIVLVTYLVLVIIKGIFISVDLEAFVFYNSFFRMVTSFFIAAQFLLLFLSSRQKQSD